LTHGLDLLHQEKIKHRGIRPNNIIIHQGSVIYTDSGYFLGNSRLRDGRSNIRSKVFTYDYAAPEVIDYELGDSTSDIYSLGYVFLDLLATDLSNRALAIVES
jgi:serine/threonine protein kinase